MLRDADISLVVKDGDPTLVYWTNAAILEGRRLGTRMFIVTAVGIVALSKGKL